MNSFQGIGGMAGGKRDDPKYFQVSGYVPKDLALQFKATCTLQEVTQSDALEEALNDWLAKVQKAVKK